MAFATLSACEALTAAAVVVHHGQRHGVFARVGVDVRRFRAEPGRAIPEVPQIADDRPIDVTRGAAVNSTGLAPVGLGVSTANDAVGGLSAYGEEAGHGSALPMSSVAVSFTNRCRRGDRHGRVFPTARRPVAEVPLVARDGVPGSSVVEPSNATVSSVSGACGVDVNSGNGGVSSCSENACIEANSFSGASRWEPTALQASGSTQETPDRKFSCHQPAGTGSAAISSSDQEPPLHRSMMGRQPWSISVGL